jgi:uncharacterized protein with ParB-like and HNH nuclease domain
MTDITEKHKNILDQVAKARKELKTDHYNMSVGEIINVYNEKEMSLNPAYQRLYRWKDKQKTDFIESLIIGIPIPPIFVAQKQDGTWDVVDGVQRLSTILELTGNLQHDGKKPLKLETCKYIPSLDGETWETIPADIQRIIKRAKLTINIILTENSIQSQYEVFQRLNTGGVHLSNQELRNCLIIMLNKDFYNEINKFKKDEVFVKLTPISEKKEEEKERMEFILRYLIARYNSNCFNNYSISQIHVRDFIDKETIKLIENKDFNLTNALEEFKATLELLDKLLGEQAFKKYDNETKKYTNAFSTQMYEVILPGLSKNLDRYKNITADKIKSIIGTIYKDEVYKNITEPGTKALNRYKLLTELSFKYFK